MTEKQPGPTPGVRLIEVSVKRELTVLFNCVTRMRFSCFPRLQKKKVFMVEAYRVLWAIIGVKLSHK